ncbi:MAG: DUF2269 family protein [Mycobacteriales bacterium]
MTFLLGLHIAAAVFLIGPLTFATSVTPRVVREGAEGLPTLRFLRRTTRIYGMASLVVFLLGLGLVRKHGVGFNQFWLAASMTLFVVALGLIFAVVVRDQGKAVTLLEAGEPAAVHAGRIAAASGAAALMWVVIVFLMVYRPGS